MIAYRAYGLDRLTLLLYLAGLGQGALWGTLGLFFALYRRDVRRAERGELGLLFLLPRGPTRFALAQAAEYLLWAGLAQLAAATDVAYRPGRVGGLLATVVFLGIPFGIGKLLELADARVLWDWGPRVYVGDFRWLLGQIPGASLSGLGAALPAWPLFAGILLYAAFFMLALRIYHEAEI